MGNGSALEVVLHDYALYKSTITLLYLLYFHYHAAVILLLCFLRTADDVRDQSSSEYGSVKMSSYFVMACHILYGRP